MTLRYTTIRWLAFAVTVLVIFLPRTVLAQDVETRVVNREYYLKIAYLIQFASFINWPQDALDDELIEIGILGKSSFDKAAETIDGKIVQGRRIIVKRSTDVKDLKSCKVLFIARSEKARLQEILAEIDGHPVLTVSEIEGFAHRWGIINFTTAGNRVRFEINIKAAKRAHLQISSRLLRVADLVDDLHPTTASQ
ncbi:MAG: hypothetical protein COA78_38810 [Blastopirellula sp.]|nr:MAG: hypothetical protein COA78_38810 [Blastopirellula sp.]